MRFLHLSRNFSSDPEHETRSVSERLGTYVSGMTTLTDRIVLGLRDRLGVCRALPTQARSGRATPLPSPPATSLAASWSSAGLFGFDS